MGIIYILLPLSVLLGTIGVLAYIWAVRSEQFKDLETPAMRALVDDAAACGRSSRKGPEAQNEAPLPPQSGASEQETSVR